MAQSETVERILDAAEQLFAEKGFAETSLRLITSKAGVNLAAVNYHFGSKKSLIQAVFTRFLDPFVVSLEQELERNEKAGNPEQSLEDLLEMLVRLVLAVKPRSGNDLSTFMRLLGLAFSQSQGHLRKYLGENGWFIREEAVLKDGKFLYTIMEVIWMPGMELTPGGCHFSPALLKNPGKDLPAFYRWVVGGLRMIVDNQGEKADPFKVEALQELTNLPDALSWLQEEESCTL